MTILLPGNTPGGAADAAALPGKLVMTRSGKGVKGN
jgi:hypothetical protein